MPILLSLFAIAGITWAIIFSRQMSVATNALLVLLVGIVFGHAFFNKSIGPLPLTLDRVLWGLLIVQLLGLCHLQRAKLKRFNRTDALVVALAIVLLLSTVMHDWRYKDNLPLARFLFFNCIPFGYYFVAKNCQLSSRQTIWIFVGLASFGVYLTLTGIAEQRGWHALVFPRFILDPEHFEFLGRARGPFLNPVSNGVFLIVGTVAGLFLWPRCNQIGKAGILALVTIALLATFLTYTRSVWLACALSVGLVVWLATAPQLRGVLMIGGVLGLLGIVLVFGDRFNNFKRDKEVTQAEMAQSAALRPMLAHVAWKMFRDKPILGHGFGQYTQAKKPYHYTETGDMPLSKVLYYMQHNVFLSYLTETGLVGLGLLVALLLTMASKAWKLWRILSRDLAERQLGLLGLVFLICYVANGMFHDVSIVPHIGALMFLLLGFIENLSDPGRLAQQENSRANTKPGLPIAA